MRAFVVRRALLRACCVLAVLTLAVGESSEVANIVDAEADALGLDGDGADDDGLGEAAEAQLGEADDPKDSKDTEGKEPGDGSDPPKGGTEEEEKKDDGNDEEEAGEDRKKPNIDNLIGSIATFEKPGPLVPTSPGEYERIPNFEYQGNPANVKNQEECQKECNQQKECRSYSWNEDRGECQWSTGSLRYGHFWNFYSKEYDMNAFGQMIATKEYFRFKGLFAIDEDQNMKTIEDKSLSDCKDICNDDPKCESFSFHEGDNACLMGVSKVEYLKGWNYFERNRPPREPGGEWRPYHQRLDSYHRTLRNREKASLGIFAERDKKIRMKKVDKEKKVKKMTRLNNERKKRLDVEMKQKEFSNEQQRKKNVLSLKQAKVDLAAAAERGKFDEAFHKQAEINRELMHKKNMESSVKGSMVERIHEKDHKDNKRLDKRLADIKDRGMKEMAAKQRETESKERLSKSEHRGRAVDMKKSAFQLVSEERKYKSFSGYSRTKKATTKAMDNLLHSKWVAEDKRDKYVGQEKEVKRQIGVEKQTHEVHRKLAKEKEQKGPPPSTANMFSVSSEEKATLPTAPNPRPDGGPTPMTTPGGR